MNEGITLNRLSSFFADCERYLGELPKKLLFSKEDFERYLEIVRGEKVKRTKGYYANYKRRKCKECGFKSLCEEKGSHVCFSDLCHKSSCANKENGIACSSISLFYKGVPIVQKPEGFYRTLLKTDYT